MLVNKYTPHHSIMAPCLGVPLHLYDISTTTRHLSIRLWILLVIKLGGRPGIGEAEKVVLPMIMKAAWTIECHRLSSHARLLPETVSVAEHGVPGCHLDTCWPTQFQEIQDGVIQHIQLPRSKILQSIGLPQISAILSILPAWGDRGLCMADSRI